MMRRAILFILLMLLTYSAAAQEKARSVTIGEEFTLHSKVLGEERPYLVYLPESYNSTKYAPKSYPVLYLLDGDAHFHFASGVVNYMSTGFSGNIQIPELIIVAIPSIRRTRDLTPTHSLKGLDGKEDPTATSSGGADSFLKFLQSELILHIEATYRTAPYRLLVGHSYGGAFAIHALERAPSTFQALIVIDPTLWWDDQVLVRRGKPFLAEAKSLRNSVYISLSNEPLFTHWKPGGYEEPVKTFARLLGANTSPGLRSKLQYFESEDHSSVPLLSLYHGLSFVFEGYKTSLDAAFKPTSDFMARYKKISERLGFELLPPEGFINDYGYFLLYRLREVDKAVEYFKLNVSLYPKSFNAYDSLAEAYMVKGDKPSAIRNYERSLELNPENQNGKDQLRKLKGQ